MHIRPAQCEAPVEIKPGIVPFVRREGLAILAAGRRIAKQVGVVEPRAVAQRVEVVACQGSGRQRGDGKCRHRQPADRSRQSAVSTSGQSKGSTRRKALNEALQLMVKEPLPIERERAG
jgi:hypothetical protein